MTGAGQRCSWSLTRQLLTLLSPPDRLQALLWTLAVLSQPQLCSTISSRCLPSTNADDPENQTITRHGHMS
jgi:hypothetical protein